LSRGMFAGLFYDRTHASEPGGGRARKDADMSVEQRRVTIRDVAREAGVSKATVSYVLNQDPRQTIAEETQTRVREAARKLGYQPSALARSLRMGKSKIVLVVWQEIVIEAGISQLMEALAAAVANVGFSLVWQVGFSREQEHLSEHLAPAVVVGLVDVTDAAAVASLQRFGAPIVMVGSWDWITAGSRAQVEYLLEQGSRPIVYAATEKPQLQHFSRVRQEAVQQACHEHGLPSPRVVTVSQRREKAREQLRDLLEVQAPPFALCAYNDGVAVAALAALSDLKLAVPEAVSVIGQDNTMMAELSNPALTTIDFDSPDLTERLIESVLSVCQGGPVLDIGPVRPKVIVRASA
jgi:DNA-binding LacI/PurR family transcriptional regulator